VIDANDLHNLKAFAIITGCPAKSWGLFVRICKGVVALPEL
jgi:hypothetical protein